MAVLSAGCYLMHWTTVIFLLSACRWPVVSSFKVAEGGTATLSCQYSVKRLGLSRVCWGRGCGTFWCSNILVQTDENGVISKGWINLMVGPRQGITVFWALHITVVVLALLKIKGDRHFLNQLRLRLTVSESDCSSNYRPCSEVADRYRLTGDVLDGQMDLAILNVRRTDSGQYCCRVDIDGIFNDKKVVMNLRVVKAPMTSLPPTTTSTDRVTELLTSTANWKTILSSHLDLLRRNSTLLHSETIIVEDSLPTLSLQINVPVLSLSLSLLLLLAGVLLFLAFKRGIHRRALKTGCFSSKEPPHIIYEIRMRRPVQENIYTLD